MAEPSIVGDGGAGVDVQHLRGFDERVGQELVGRVERMVDPEAAAALGQRAAHGEVPEDRDRAEERCPRSGRWPRCRFRTLGPRRRWCRLPKTPAWNGPLPPRPEIAVPGPETSSCELGGRVVDPDRTGAGIHPQAPAGAGVAPEADVGVVRHPDESPVVRRAALEEPDPGRGVAGLPDPHPPSHIQAASLAGSRDRDPVESRPQAGRAAQGVPDPALTVRRDVDKAGPRLAVGEGEAAAAPAAVHLGALDVNGPGGLLRARRRLLRCRPG